VAAGMTATSYGRAGATVRYADAAECRVRLMPVLVTIRCICSGIRVDGANPVHLAGAGGKMLAMAAPDDSRLSRLASRTVAADSRYGARYPPKWSAT